MSVDFAFDAPGTWVIEDNGVPDDGFFQIRDPSGNVAATFAIPAALGDFIRFTTDSIAGVHVVVNLTESIGSNDFIIGDLTDASITPDSIVVQEVRTGGQVNLASNGTIGEGGDADADPDIVALSLILSAATGIGSDAQAIETQVAALEAESNTGGINLANSGAVTIGELTEQVEGLHAITSGNVTLTNLGSIVLLKANQTNFDPPIQTGAGNATLIANGYDSDIVSMTSDSTVIEALGGSLFLKAGRDVVLDKTSRSQNDLTIEAGRDFVGSGVLTLGGANLSVTAGRNLSSNGVGASFSDVILTAGAGAAMTLGAGFGIFGRRITLNADQLEIEDEVSAEFVTVAPVSAGRPIDLGSAAASPFALQLSDTELDFIFREQLVIGSDTAGRVTVWGSVTPGNGLPGIVTLSGRNVDVRGTLNVPENLILRARDNVTQYSTAVIEAGTLTVQVDSSDDDAGAGGTATLTNAGSPGGIIISGNADNDTLNGALFAPDQMFGLGGSDVLRGFGGNDLLDGGTGADAMSGGLGDDTYHVDNAGDSVSELAGQGFDRIVATASYVLAASAEVEVISTADLGSAAPINLTGSDTNNRINGNSGPNILSGAGGNDSIIGYIGNDILNGGAGDDAMEGGHDNDTLNGGADNDNLIGGLGNDVLDGGTGVDQMFGTGDDDVLAGGAGGDVLNGGGGTDTADYAGNFGAVSVNLATGVGQFNYAQGDTLTDIENVNGTEYGDILTGSAVVNMIVGNGGNDLISGGAGADTLGGGAGTDTLSYAGNFGGVSIDLQAGTGLFNYAHGDVLTGFENVVGTEFADILRGDGGNNRLEGNGQNDQLTGRGGNDVLDGGLGADALDGGLDVDTADYAGEFGGVSINLATGTGQFNSAHGDTLTGIEKVIGTSFGDIFWSNNLANVFTGGAGNDEFVFNAGFSQDAITDFAGNGPAAGDTVRFAAGLFANFADMISKSAQVGSDVVITLNAANTLTLQNTTLASLDSSDFLYA